MDTIANRIIEILPNGIIDRQESFDEYLDDEVVNEMRSKLV